MKCGICDKDIFGVETDDVIVCGSCVTTPLPLEKKEDDIDKALKERMDLSHVVSEQRPTKPKGKLWSMVHAEFHRSSKNPIEKKMQVVIPTCVVKSNSLRNRNYTIGDLVLQFNDKGEATFPSYEAYKVREWMSLKPGRLEFVTISTDIPSKSLEEIFEEAKKEIEAAKEAADINETVDIKVLKPKKVKKFRKNSEDLDGKGT